MTTTRLFTHCRDSVRWLVLTMVVGLIALAGAVLACGPAASSSTDAGELVAGAPSRDQPPPGGSEPIHLPQTSGDSNPTPLPTVCAAGSDKDGNSETICGLTIPEPLDTGNMTSSIYYLVEDAIKKEEANSSSTLRRAPDGSSSGGGVRPERHRVRIILTLTTDGSAVINWLKEHEFAYEDKRHNGHIFAGVEILLIPELSELDGVFLIEEPIKNDPA